MIFITQDGQVEIEVTDAFRFMNKNLAYGTSEVKVNCTTSVLQKLYSLCDHYTEQVMKDKFGFVDIQKRRYQSMIKEECFDKTEIAVLESCDQSDLKQLWNLSMFLQNESCINYAVRGLLHKNMQSYAKT